MSNSEEYRKKHTYKVRFSTDFRWYDNDRGRQLSLFYMVSPWRLTPARTPSSDGCMLT